MSRQDLLEVRVNALEQIQVRLSARAERQVRTEVARSPLLVAAVLGGVGLRQIVAARTHILRHIERERLCGHRDALPHRAQHAGKLVAQTQRMQRERNAVVERSEVIQRRRSAEKRLHHARADLPHCILIEPARGSLAGIACE